MIVNIRIDVRREVAKLYIRTQIRIDVAGKEEQSCGAVRRLSSTTEEKAYDSTQLRKSYSSSQLLLSCNKLREYFVTLIKSSFLH